MVDQLNNSSSSTNSLVVATSNGSRATVGNPRASLQNACKNFASLSCGGSSVGDIGLFLLKVAALETVRRVSKSKCPPVWHGVQALQFLCYPPFKWIQRWAPFKGLIKGVQMISKPLLVLSLATALSDELTHCNDTSDDNDGSRAHSATTPEESPSSESALDASDGSTENAAPENWILDLQKELTNQGITLPERINEHELRRFYNAANGDFQTFLLSIKNTIRWRETYRILSEEELEPWSNVVFWHGYDLKNHPCLVVRLGLACKHLPPQDRPRFAQAIISQVEYGILHLLNKDSPQIMVVVDCAGVTPLRIPMQMVRTCSSYLQHNFPNRLGCLLIIRLPPVARVIVQTFLQLLKPTTKKKVRVEGKMYHKALSEYLQAVPGYLGGSCTCQRCVDTGDCIMPGRAANDTIKMEHGYRYITDSEDRASSLLLTSHADSLAGASWEHLLMKAVIGILIVWSIVALVAGLYDT